MQQHQNSKYNVCTAANLTNQTKPGGRDITHEVFKALLISGGRLMVVGIGGSLATRLGGVIVPSLFLRLSTFHHETVHYKSTWLVSYFCYYLGQYTKSVLTRNNRV